MKAGEGQPHPLSGTAVALQLHTHTKALGVESKVSEGKDVMKEAMVEVQENGFIE